MNNDLGSDDSTTVTLPIKSKSEVRQPIPETRHDRRKTPKKLKVTMTDKVIMTAEKEDERFHPLI